MQVSSIYGLTTTPLTGWYQGSKHAMEGLSDALRMEVAKDGIAIVLIEPGGVDTGIWDTMFGQKVPDNGDPDFAKKLISESGEAAPTLTYDFPDTPTRN